MKKFFAILLSIIMVLTMALSVSAAQFVPSITNKGAPDLIVIDRINGKDVVGFITDADGNKVSTEYMDCLVISSINDALSGKELPEGVKEELIKVYDEMKEGAKISDLCPELKDIVKEKWGNDKNVDDLVVKDLFDVTDYCEDLKTHLNGGSILDLTFNVGIPSGSFITAMVYVDGKWVPVHDCINNGDGTVTVKFTQICPVAFLVPGGNGQNMDVVSPTTGDAMDVIIWGSVMLISLGAIVALIIYRRKVNG
jgi:hypothetical protein